RFKTPDALQSHNMVHLDIKPFECAERSDLPAGGSEDLEMRTLRLDPVWHAIGSELRSLGSLVSVGKADATAHTVQPQLYCCWWFYWELPSPTTVLLLLLVLLGAAQYNHSSAA
ncbi:hypothetical protein CRUP_001900, partial [Coryphaenoides rupestris]